MTGAVYVGGDVLHADPKDCPHFNEHTCPTCDFDRYYANKHREQCPWFAQTGPSCDHDRHEVHEGVRMGRAPGGTGRFSHWEPCEEGAG